MLLPGISTLCVGQISPVPMSREASAPGSRATIRLLPMWPVPPSGPDDVAEQSLCEVATGGRRFKGSGPLHPPRGLPDTTV